MNSIEWFYATVARKPADRPAAWLGMPDILAQKSLFAEYEVSDLDALLEMDIAILTVFATVSCTCLLTG